MWYITQKIRIPRIDAFTNIKSRPEPKFEIWGSFFNFQLNSTNFIHIPVPILIDYLPLLLLVPFTVLNPLLDRSFQTFLSCEYFIKLFVQVACTRWFNTKSVLELLLHMPELLTTEPPFFMRVVVGIDVRESGCTGQVGWRSVQVSANVELVGLWLDWWNVKHNAVSGRLLVISGCFKR